jgi:L-asparaginase / beta-aspartyl-peptidase
MPIAIVVHGGAGTLQPERRAVAEAGSKAAALVGWRILQAGGSALDAVEAAVRVLEDDPNFNAGRGACLTRNGTIELDAGIMDGRTLAVGAVAVVEHIKNPIVLARKVLESEHVLLSGRGAERFAAEHGFPFCTFDDLLTERQHQFWKTRNDADEPRYYRRELGSITREEKHGTVGAVALDASGALAAATSTGGIHYKYPGRVGDSPLVGCGFYADEYAAISCTGDGEDFTRLLIAKRAADYVAGGAVAQAAAEAAIAFLSAHAKGTGGLIVVDRQGNVGFHWNSANLVRAYLTESLTEPVVGV